MEGTVSSLEPRAAGLLAHPTSFPGRFGIGDLGPAAVGFLDWSRRAGQGVWQVLPLGPTGIGDSPYNALSTMAGNPLLISPEVLAADGLVDEGLLATAPRFSDDRVEFRKVAAWKRELVRASWERFRHAPPAGAREAFDAFLSAPEQQPWLEDWALFVALRGRHDRRPWHEWDPPLAHRDPGAVREARTALAADIDLARWSQFLFFAQWDRLRRHARERGIRILGDIPIYVALDSADVWANRDLFQIAADGRPERVAGVPPDYFSADGQLWGNPLYRWDRLAEDGHRWWITRASINLRLADLLRLDHFRGFAAYWAVPGDATTAAEGMWVPGPGILPFEAMRERLGGLPFVAEDLGIITDDVVELRERLGLPGMRVLQFAFQEPDSTHLPHHHVPHSVVYTGTHDNDTTVGWFKNAGEDERRRACLYLGATASSIDEAMIRAAYTSVAAIAIVPLQDALGLGSEARMNRPGIPNGNWGWRVSEGMLDDARAERLAGLGDVAGRARHSP